MGKIIGKLLMVGVFLLLSSTFAASGVLAFIEL